MKIPDSVRALLLVESDPITNAIATEGNEHMQLLFAVWREFVEPGSLEDISCGICRQRILRNFRELYPTLAELQFEYNLLKDLKDAATPFPYPGNGDGIAKFLKS